MECNKSTIEESECIPSKSGSDTNRREMVVVNGRRGLYLTTSFIYLSFTGYFWYANSNTRDGTRCTKNHRVSEHNVYGER